MGAWMHGCMDGWMNEWMDGCMDVRLCLYQAMYNKDQNFIGGEKQPD